MNSKNKLPQIDYLGKKTAIAIKRILGKIWEIEHQELGIASSYPDNLVQLINKIFNPKRKLSAINELIQSLPDLAIFHNEFDYLDVSFEALEKQHLLRIISTRKAKRVTVTPEGLILLSLLETAHQSGDHYYIDPNMMASKLTTLIDLYDAKISAHLVRLEKSYREELRMSEIGLLLFFLINGSVSEEYPCVNVNIDVTQTIETIVRAYSGDTKGKRNEFHWRGWYLTEANRKLGGVLVNKEPNYYLKGDSVSFVEEEICSKVTKDIDSYASFQKGWRRLLEEYQRGRPLLQRHSIAHFSQSRVDAIYNVMIRKAKEKGL